MAIKEAPRSYQSLVIEEKIQKFWDQNQIYQHTKELKQDQPKFSFLDGPYCSGRIHLGTAWNKIIKDSPMFQINVRFQCP